MTDDGGLVAVPVSGDGADVITYSAAGGATAADVFAEPERKIVRLDVGSRPDLLVMQVSAADPFEAQLAAWNPATGTMLWETAAGVFPSSVVWDVGADSRVLATDGTTVRLLDVDGAVVNEWQFDEPRAATGIVATASGYAIVVNDGTVLLPGTDGNAGGVSVSIGRPIVDLRPLSGADGVTTVDASGAVSSWAADGSPISQIVVYQASAVNDVALSIGDTSIGAATTSGTVVVTDLSGATQELRLEHPEGSVDSLAFSPAGDQIVTGVGQRLSDVAFDDTVSRWDLAGVRMATFGGEGEDVNGCANFRNTVRFSPNGDLIASTSHDFTVDVRRAESGELVVTLPPHVSSVLDVAFSPSGERLVASSDDGVVRVWSTDDFTMQSEFIGPPGGYWSIAVMPDGNSLIVSDLTGAIRRIDATTGAELVVFAGTTSRSGRLAVSPDGEIVAAASDGNTVALWSTETGEQLAVAEGHTSPVSSVAFSSDGTMLVTGSGDTTVRTWRVVRA